MTQKILRPVHITIRDVLPGRVTPVDAGNIPLPESAGRALTQEQDNAVLRSIIISNVIAVVPVGSGPLKAGTKLKGFLI